MNRHTRLLFTQTRAASIHPELFAKAHEKYTLFRSMSRAGTPTDNPIIEAVNGWIKQEMYCDFKLHRCDNLQAGLDALVHYYNHTRPAYALNYRSPIQFKTEQGF